MRTNMQNTALAILQITALAGMLVRMLLHVSSHRRMLVARKGRGKAKARKPGGGKAKGRGKAKGHKK